KLRVEQNVKNKVDILFMVDNSNSMDAMQAELRKKFPQFFQVFSKLAQEGTLADLQIGVVTSDFGAGATGAPGCMPSPGGQQGKLQGIGAVANKCIGAKPTATPAVMGTCAALGSDCLHDADCTCKKPLNTN